MTKAQIEVELARLAIPASEVFHKLTNWSRTISTSNKEDVDLHAGKYRAAVITYRSQIPSRNKLTGKMENRIWYNLVTDIPGMLASKKAWKTLPYNTYYYR